MALHAAVVPRPTGNFETAPTTYFEIHGPEGLSGVALARALGELGHGRLWPDGDLPLDQLGELPTRGMLTLTPFSRPPSSSSSSAEVWLVAVKGPDCGQHLHLARGTYSIGRGECDLHALDPGLSRHHADIVVDRTSIALFQASETSALVPGTSTGTPQLLALGDEFVLGNTTFRICPIQPEGSAEGAATATIWPPATTSLRGSTTAGRPWLMMTTAVLPLIIGIVLALTLGSWIFLAFSALGLVTGGIPAASELAARKKLRRHICNLSAERIAEIERLVPPVGLRAFRSSDSSGLAIDMAATEHPLRYGSGSVLPPLTLDPPTDRGPQIVRVPGPVVVTVSPGSLGLIAGAGGLLEAVIRSTVLQLAYSCSRADASLVIVGGAGELPPETRYLPGVRACQNVEGAHAILDGLSPGSVVMAMPGLRDVERLLSMVASVAGSRKSPGVILTGAGQHESANWILDTTASCLGGRDPDLPVSLDGISKPTLAGAAIAAEREIRSGTTPLVGAGSPHRPEPGRRPEDPKIVWKSSSESSLLCRLGGSSEGLRNLDFVSDGPHVLVTGTTGSGKSELLKSMTMDLVCTYGPDQLALVLLDFKGGATLGRYSGTPHCQSLVTDLNVESGERILEGLRVELRRRESVFREADAEDYPRYRRQAPPDAQPIPRLLVIVDEFRVLTDEMPDAVQELMRIATVGRSLGVHLLLSTQRPQGVVTASMRANINTVISLRLLSAIDSQELLGSPVAAELPATTPGLGFMRRAGEAPRHFRSVPVDPEAPIWSVRQIGPDFQDSRVVATVHGREASTTSPSRILAAMTSGSSSPPLPAVSFTPPLPSDVHGIPEMLRRERPHGAIALGLIDDLAHQRVSPLWWHPEKQRRLAVVSGPGSTAPAALLSVLQSLARVEPERHIYVLDGAGYFSSAAKLPRVAGYVGAEEPERVPQLLGVFADPSTGSAVSPATRVLLVSGMAAWAAAMGASAFAALDDQLAALARASEQRNTCLIVIGDRDLMSSRYLALAEHRLYLRFGLGHETIMGWPRLRNTAPFPGRAVWTEPAIDEQGVVAQLCTPPPSSPYGAGPEAHLPLRSCLPLPARVVHNHLSPDGGSPGRYPVGLIGPDNRAWTWEPGPVGVVLGGPSSGKSGLLRLLAHQLGEHVHVGHDVDSERPAPDVLLLDDVLELTDQQLARLDVMIRAGTHVVMTAGPDRTGLMRLPAAARMLPSSAFLVLNPRQASDGEVPGWRLQPHQQAQPGRAVAMVNGTLTQLQCAYVDNGPRAAS